MELKDEVMQEVLKLLWFHSDSCQTSIEHIWFPLMEVQKITGKKRNEIMAYFKYLIEKKVIQQTSTEPLLYEFTEFGKQIKMLGDIENHDRPIF